MDDFSKIMLRAEYDGALNAARSYLEARDFDKALAQAKKARDMTEVGSVEEANALIAVIEKESKRHASDTAEREARLKRELEQQRERARLAKEAAEEAARQGAANSHNSSQQMAKTLSLLGKVALVLSIAMFVIPIVRGSMDYFLWTANVGLLRLVVVIAVALYTFSAFNRNAFPSGGVALPLVWSAVASFLTSAAIVQRTTMSGSDVLRRTAMFFVFCLVIVLIMRAVGNAVRKERA